MKSPLNKKFLWASILVHLLVFILIGLSYQDSKIKRTFVAYGRHSKRITHAFFRNMKAPVSSTNQKYLKARREREAKNAARLKKKREQRRKLQQKKKQARKLAQKKKAPTKVVKAKKKQPPKKIKKKKIPQKKPEKKKDEAEDELEEEFLHFNLMGETDPKMILYQRHIQEEVDRVWRPPLGVPKGTECVVAFKIDRDGKVKEFVVKKSSQMLIYDLSIIRVSKEFAFNKCLWGKSFEINFRQ